ncbi:hypothetical protein LWP59_19685 [Amycolatopsis acidiphila]|uniref:Thioredoxin n=1 Tax=Amycolatopsis acidiphila TaxID=715473 RepID=A0A558A483_9PSEU|nr:hypothetical protein [Amycolatopsis acidiphila]TVT19063.1 hypothetical protein FNH06_25710 [Amycolatopsis acidiphila]UIJ63693.1 hypothetical protein LWP59_19685 [Amycolatopsis acidiphila]GHG67413.1 hypothetical protein GCM10017788_26280 [Amycolatopsis acidiphila]
MTDTALERDAARLEYARDAVEHAYDEGWTDGLPIVPVTAAMVEEFLAATPRPPDEVVAALPHLDRECTVEQAAVNAAMAGCRPEYFPVVLAAWDALMHQPSVTGGGWQSTSGPAPLIVVNGPVRAELGINSTGGVLGPGFRANATIARAVGLVVRNVLGIRPHELEQATQGLPGRWSLCVGENEEESPWEPLSAELGLPAGADAVSALLLRTCEFVDNRHTQDPEEVLWDFCDTIARTGAAIGRFSSAGLVLSVEHAQLLAGGGFAKADVQQWLHDHAVRSHADLERAGKGLDGLQAPGIDEYGLHMTPSPEQIPIIVAGARNAAMSMVVRPFGFSGWSRTAHPVRRG